MKQPLRVLLVVALASLLTAASCPTAKHTTVISDTALFELLNDTHTVEQKALCGQPSCAGVPAVPTVQGWTLAKSQGFNTAFLPAVEAGRQFNVVLATWDPSQPAPTELRALVKSLGDSLAAITLDFPESPTKTTLLGNIGKGQQIVLNVFDLVVLSKGAAK
jgi:hypothetical protein